MSIKPRSETHLVELVLAELRKIDGCWAHKVHGSKFATAGEPDIDACINGRAVKIELKMPGNKPTPIQMANLRRWERAGALAFWATSVDEVRTFLDFLDLPGFTNPQLCRHDEGTHQHPEAAYCRRCGVEV